MNKKVTVMMVDDNPLDRELVKDALESSDHNFELIETTSLAELKISLKKHKVDVVLTDYNILGNNGLDIADFVFSTCPNTPVIMVTGTGSEEVAAAAIKKGVSDYVIKTNAHIRRLPITINKCLEVVKLNNEREEAIKKETLAKEFWEKTFDTISDAIVIMDSQMNIVMANSSAKNMFPEAEVVGSLCFDLFSGRSEPCDHCPVSTTLSDHLRHDDIFFNPALNKTLHVSSSLMENSPTGEPFVVCSAKDVTKVKELEFMLAQKNKMEAVGLLAGGMAHNFNNNLSIVLGNIELASLNAPHNSEIVDYLSKARVGVMRSRDLIQQIMAYSRPDDHRDGFFQLSTIIDETRNILRPTIPATINLRYETSPESQSLIVHANATRIQEVLVNLCNNAIHAMNEEGTLTIALGTAVLNKDDISFQYEACQPGDFAVISVQDTGHGMAREIMDKIFDPFFTTKGVKEGTGMGLTTVQGIIKGLGGMIKVDSSPSQGTTFYLYIPIAKEPQPEEIVPASSSDMPKGTEKILFIDDEEMLAKTGEEILTAMGYRVSIMTESTEALKLFEANPDFFDLVITDQTMPNLTGKELIPKIKKIRPDIPTILCTGYSSKINEETANSIDISAFLMKPVDFPQLLQTVRRVLDGEIEGEPK